MKVKKLRSFVLPTIYLIAIGAIVISVFLLGETIKSYKSMEEEETTYVVGSIVENIVPVLKEDEAKTSPPFKSEEVQISKNFYEKDADEKKQQSSLIYYEGTYMPNSGILYKSDNEFEVLATHSGTVTNVKEDEILGTIVEIEYNPNLKTIYQSLKNIKIKNGDRIEQGQVIGYSGSNNLEPTNKNELLFEVYYNGKLLNPEKFYNTELKTYEE